MPQNRNRRGFVLLMVLLVLALGGMALATIARGSLRHAAQVSRTQEDLQRKWGELSVRRSILGSADAILAAGQPSAGAPVATVSARLSLGTLDFDVVVSDEQAKANLNTLTARNGRVRAMRAANAIMRTGGAGSGLLFNIPSAKRGIADSGPIAPSMVDPQPPEIVDNEPIRISPVVESFGQVFPATPPDLLFPRPGIASPISDLTCWGSGALNVRRASKASIIEICAPVLSAAQVEQLVRLRITSGDVPLDRMLAVVGANDGDRIRLAGRLKDQSWCYSLWIAAESREKTTYALFVNDEIDEDHVTMFSFEW